MKKTAWYPLNTKPARDGVYEVRVPEFASLGYIFHVVSYARFWHGEWMRGFPYFGDAQDCECESLIQDKEWRGLTKESK
jgi:hypothetical protein